MTEIGVSSIAAYAAQSDYSKNTKNKTMKDIIVDDCQIQGVLVSCIKIY